MVGGVPGPAPRALLWWRGELNGSGWYEIVTDPEPEVQGHQVYARDFF